jgi:hypothetical protein
LETTPDELFYRGIFFTVAHEMGHIIDGILGTFYPDQISYDCSEEERIQMFARKNTLNARHKFICNEKGIGHMEFYSVYTKSEVFADVLACEAMNNLANRKNMENNNKRNFILRIPILSLLTSNRNFLPESYGDGIHPENKLRFDMAVTSSSFARKLKENNIELEEIYQQCPVVPIF